jgi:hypothetical protein
MNGFDILILLLVAGLGWLFMAVGYARGFNDGKREGYHRGRAVSRQEFWQE